MTKSEADAEAEEAGLPKSEAEAEAEEAELIVSLHFFFLPFKSCGCDVTELSASVVSSSALRFIPSLYTE